MKDINYSSLEEKIIESLVNSANIATTMNECLWVGDENHKTLYVNPVFEKLSGYCLKEAVGKDCIFFFDDPSKKIISRHHRLRPIGKSSQYEATLLAKSGKTIPLLISGAPTSDGGTIGIFTDLTKVKNLAQKQRVSQLIIKHSSDAIVVLDKNRKIKLWSSGATKLFGHKEKDVLNKSISIVIPPSEEESNIQFLKEVEKKSHVKNLESIRLHREGILINVSIAVTKVTDENNKTIGYLVIYQDISAQKKNTTELQKRFEAIQDAYKELGLQKRQNDYISEILALATNDSSLQNLSKMIVSATCMLTKCDGVVLRLLNHDYLKYQSSIGVDQNWLDKNKIPLKNSLGEEAFHKRRPLIIHNIDEDNKHQSKKLLKSHQFKTLILIPLQTHENNIGTLSLYVTDPAKFRLIEKDFLENFGKHCSLALFTKLHQSSQPSSI